MTMFRIIGYFIELLARVNLITGSNGHHFAWMIIYLGATEFLLRCKKPSILLFLRCGLIFKRFLRGRGAIHHSRYGYLQNKLNIITNPLKSRFTTKIPPYIRWCVSPFVYFFTMAVSSRHNKKDESEDEGSHPDESTDGESNENIEETSDQSENEEKVTDTTKTYTDLAIAFSESTIPETLQKRKAEAEDEKKAKRSRSSDTLAEISSFENTSFSHSEMEANEGKANPSLASRGSPYTAEDRMSLISSSRLVPDFNEKALLTHDETQQYPQKSEKVVSQEMCKVSQMQGDEFSSTLETPSQSPSPENRSQEIVSSSFMAKICKSLSSDFFPGKKTCISGSPTRKKFFRSKSFSEDYQSRSDDTCQIESQELVCFDTPSTSRSTSQHTDNILHQERISNDDVTEEILNNSIESLPETNPIATSSPCSLDSSTSTDECIKTFDRDMIAHHPKDASRMSDSPRQNSAEIFTHALSMSACTSENKRVPNETKEYCQKYGEKTCEVSTGQSRDGNVVVSEKSSLCTYEKNTGRNTMESTRGHQNASNCTMHSWDRPGCSKDPEYYSSLPCKSCKGSESVDYYRSYPGLTLQPLKVKKDAIYQKKFYMHKKEIVLPVQLGRVIRWAITISKNMAHNVPRVSDSDEDKLPLDKYHELAQELFEGFMMAYNSTIVKESKVISDKNSKRAKRKRQKEESRETVYIESSFQEESPSSDQSDDDISLNSQECPIASFSPASLSRPASETNLSRVNVSPVKQVCRVSPVLSQSVSCPPPAQSLDKSESLVVTNSSAESYDYGSISSENFPLQPVKIRFIDRDEMPSFRRIIFCRNSLMSSACEQNIPIKLKAFFRVERMQSPKKPCLPISVEEFLQDLHENQKQYYEMLYDESPAFNVREVDMTRCVIPLRNIESDDADYELVGDTLKPGTSKLGHSSDTRDSFNNVSSTAPKSQKTRHRQAQKGQIISVQANLRAGNRQKVDEGESSKSELNEAVNMNVFDTAYREIAQPEVEYLGKTSLKPMCKDEHPISSFQTERTIPKSEDKVLQSEESVDDLMIFERKDTENQFGESNVISRDSCENNALLNPFEEPFTASLEEREFTHCASNNASVDMKSLEQPFQSKKFNINYFTEMSAEKQFKIWKNPEGTPPPDKISKALCFESMFEKEQTAMLESLRKSFWETSNMKISTVTSEADQNVILQNSRVSSTSKETVNRHQIREMFENEQRAIFESLSSFSEEKSSRSDCEGISTDNQCEISISPPSAETLSTRRFSDMFDAEQRAILESLSLTKQLGDSEDQGNQFMAMGYKAQRGLNISEYHNLPEGKSTCESSTYREAKLKIEKVCSSTCAEILLRDENVTDSSIPKVQTELINENVCPRSGLAQFPIIIDVRHISSSESENEETCPPLLREEINTGVNRPSYTSGADSVSKQNLAQNIELELSPDSLDSGSRETDAFSTSHEEKSENSKDTQSS